MSTTVYRAATRQVRAYCESVPTSSVIAEHQQAMECYELEDLLRVGVQLYDHFVWLDEQWRLRMARGETAYSEEVDQALTQLFDWWGQPCSQVEAHITRMEELGFQVTGADEFRARCAEFRATD